jgi:aldose sugar dehydrogenase
MLRPLASLSYTRLFLLTILFLSVIPIQHHILNNVANALISPHKHNLSLRALTSPPPLQVSLPTIKDRSLKAEVIATGLKRPTSMAFLGLNDFLVLEKDNGTVRRVVNGMLLSQPLLKVNVANKDERGMLGIAIAKHKDRQSMSTYVFLYYTEARKNGEDICPYPSLICKPGHDPLGNNLYRYELVNNGTKLVNPKLLLHLEAVPGPSHNGGKIKIGPDNNVYISVGDINLPITQASNVQDPDEEPDGHGGILRITQDGQPVPNPPLGDNPPLNFYYAYGIRNSFGINFDPITKQLWDTENGPGYGDEINLVEPGFNSGWKKVQGIWYPDASNPYFAGHVAPPNPPGLVDFEGRGKYHPPQFTWLITAAPTGLAFLNSDKLGKKYENDLFVGTVKPDGDLYHFKLNQNRTGFMHNASLVNKDVYHINKSIYYPSNSTNFRQLIFAEDFGEISDVQVGPDGYLYIVSYKQGAIFRIVPATKSPDTPAFK